MIKTSQFKNEIKKIEDIFQSLDLTDSKKKILDALSQFEQQSALLPDDPLLSAVLKWYRNLFLQKACFFPRSEQLLDETLSAFENLTEPVYLRWKLKTFLSLGYVHKAQCNYFDAESYLKDALEIALAEPSLFKFLGEIYSLLSKVNLSLQRYGQAKRYTALEKEASYENYKADPSDDDAAMIYAHALINFSRTNRLIGFVDQSIQSHLDEAIEIFNRLDNEKGLLRARLEMCEFQFAMNITGPTMKNTLSLEPVLKRKKMRKEQMQAGLLIAKIYKKILDYELAEKKINDIILLAKKHQMASEQIMADALFELGSVYSAMNELPQALKLFRRSAKIGMVLGRKSIILRSFNASWLIDQYKANDLLGSDLVYGDATFVRNRVERKISPFKESRTKVKLFASTMFVDIVNFSSMMLKSDENLTVKMVDELIDRMYLIIYQHGGYIDKFLGDGFMAIFEHGKTNQQKTAFNTIKSAMDILRALKHKNYKLKKNYGVHENINVRIGISTGEIYALLLGNYIKTEFTYLGNSVNLASKLESQAASHYMLIDEDTNLLLKNLIRSTPEQIDIPGLGKTNAYRVIQLARTTERHFNSNRTLPDGKA